jgi:hypothetical protein
VSPLPLSPGRVLGITRAVRDEAVAARPVVVAGEGAARLAAELAAGARPGLVTSGGAPDGAGVYVRVVSGDPSRDDVAALRRATRAGIPLVVVRSAHGSEPVPYVPARELVEAPGGSPALVEVVEAIVRAGGDRLVATAAGVPALREPLGRMLVGRAALQTGLVGAAARAGGARFPIMATQQVRLLLRLATVNGRDAGRDQAVELAGVIGLGLGLRAVARRTPLPAPVVGMATGYLGTRLIGALAALRFASGAAGKPGL